MLGEGEDPGEPVPLKVGQGPAGDVRARLDADVRVEPDSDLAGRPLADLERDGLSRVLALAERGIPRFGWSPRRDRPLVAGDRVIVLATRAGLSTFLAGNRPPVSAP